MLSFKQKYLKVKSFLKRAFFAISGFIILPIGALVAIPKRIALSRNKKIKASLDRKLNARAIIRCDANNIKEIISGKELLPFFKEDFTKSQKMVLIQSRIPFFIFTLQNMFTHLVRKFTPLTILGGTIGIGVVLFTDPVGLSKNYLRIIPFLVGSPLFLATTLWSLTYVVMYPFLYCRYPYCTLTTLEFIQDTFKELFIKNNHPKDYGLFLRSTIASLPEFAAEDQDTIRDLMKTSERWHFKNDIDDLVVSKSKNIVRIFKQVTPLPNTIIPTILAYAYPTYFNSTYTNSPSSFNRIVYDKAHLPAKRKKLGPAE